MALCRLAEIVFTRGGHTFFRNESDQKKQNINGTFLLYNGGARNLSKTAKICLTLCALIPLCLIFSAVSAVCMNMYTPDKNAANQNVYAQYIRVNNNDYYLIDSVSIEKGYFDEVTYHRLSRTVDFDFDSIEKVSTFNISTDIPLFTGIAKISVGLDNDIYCNLLSYKENEYKELGNDFYAEKGFVLPPVSAVNISQLDIFVYDGTDKRANIPILTFTDYNDIEHFLLHYQDYISKYTSENSGDLVCFIKYKNYTFEEQLDEYELAELL